MEDCFFTHCYNGSIGMSGERRMDIIRRCNFYRAGCAISCSAPGISHIIDNNLMVDCSLAEDKNIMLSVIPGYIPDGGNGATCFKGSNLGMIFAHNIVSDGSPAAPGWYADCSGAQGCRIIGNAFWNGSWIFNEAFVNDTFIQGNVFYRADIVSRYCTRLNVLENLFYESHVAWSQHDRSESAQWIHAAVQKRLHWFGASWHWLSCRSKRRRQKLVSRGIPAVNGGLQPRLGATGRGADQQ